jgi:glutamine amidotransferase
VRLVPTDPALKIPHMGWNELKIERPHPLLDGIESGAHVYFVHSYELRAKDAADVLATTDYGGALTAMIARGNIAGTQFHPEKSQAVGLRLLRNFLEWRP